MKTPLAIGLLSVFFTGPACFAAESVFPLPENPVLPDGLGVNIHFTDPRPGEMEMLAEGGFRWVRMDLSWGGTERAKGQYDFSAYDRLMAALEPHGIHALLILDYSNRFYDGGLSPSSEEGRRAFARWAAAAVQRYRGRGVLWEMYNEPNIGFWKPRPDVKQYVKLALEVGTAIRQVAPEEAYIGPATSQVDLAFLEECFKAGLLEYWSAVSVHPYRQSAPETAAADYARLRRLIDRYAPQGKRIPILSGEWGYSSAWSRMDDEKQGKLLPRQWLANLASGVPLSIWYDWHDDGPDPKEPEHHFGTVRHPHRGDQQPVYEPKPAYLAAKTLTGVLRGFRFNKRLAVGSEEDYVLLFTKGDDVRLAAWTISQDQHAVVVPVSPGRFSATGHTGGQAAPRTATAEGLAILLTDAPQYLVPDGPNDLLRIAAAWERVAPELSMPATRGAKIELGLENPLGRPIRVVQGGQGVDVEPSGRVAVAASFDVPRMAEPVPVRVKCEVEGMGVIAQDTRVLATNPLAATVLPRVGGVLPIRVENPSGEAFAGRVGLTNVEGLDPAQRSAPIEFKPGEVETTASFQAEPTAARYRVGVRIEDAEGDVQMAVPAAGFETVDDFARNSAGDLGGAYALVPDGDPKVASTQTVALAEPPEGLPVAPARVLKITYDFAEGWKFARLVPQSDSLRKIEGRPTALGMWIHGDGSVNHPRLRFTDSTGQTFQPGADPIKWTGWQYVVFPMQGAKSGHWGGADDGHVHYPIRWDSLFLIDSAARQKTQGELYLASPTLIWRR